MADKRIEICKALFDYDSNYRISATQFRGFMAYLFANISEFHHHSADSYHYPLIQYKRLDKRIAIIGIDRFAEIVAKNTSDIDHITTKKQKIPIKNIQIENSEFVCKYGTFQYEFVSPWIALNKQNYEKFRIFNSEQRKEQLERILVGNILSLYKGLGIHIENRIEVKIQNQFIKKTTAHENTFIGFFPRFTSTINIPEYLGVGKSVSKGFGVVKSIDC